MDQSTGCPDDYAELFQAYFPMMRGVVAGSGITSDDVEDVAMDILARFVEKGGIAYYDPEHLHDVGETPDLPGARFRKAKFKGMLRGFTATYVMQYRDKQMTKHRREPWRLEGSSTAGFSGPDSNGDSWAEKLLSGGGYGVNTSEVLDSEVSLSIVQAIKTAHAELVPKTTRFRNYPRFIELCIEHGYLDGKLDRRAIEAELGVAGSTVTSMLKELRDTMRPLLADAGVLSRAS